MASKSGPNEKNVEGQGGVPVGGTGPGSSPGASTNNLMRVVVQIGDRRFDEDLAQQAAIAPNIEALDEALCTNPSRFAEWAMLEALARTEHDAVAAVVAVLETDIKEMEARIYLDTVAASAGGKPMTVDAIKATVTVDPRRLVLVRRKQEAEGAQLAAKDALEKLIVGRKTMEQRRESLLALASNWRKEMDGKLQVNLQQYKPGGR